MGKIIEFALCQLTYFITICPDEHEFVSVLRPEGSIKSFTIGIYCADFTRIQALKEIGDNRLKSGLFNN